MTWTTPLSALLLLVCSAGCAVSPYQNRLLPDENGMPKIYFFAYGKFCGPGYPALKLRQKLIDHWPPADDLDTICYAHDQCYTSTFDDSDICDSALHMMAIQYQNEFQNDGCWNVMTDVVIAFFGKNYGKSDTPSGTISGQLAHTILGIPQAAFWAATKAPLRPFLKSPKEGSCNVSPEADPISIVKSFEDFYVKSGLNEAKRSIVIPVPQ